MIGKNDIYCQYMYNYPHKKAYGEIQKLNIINLKEEIESKTSGLYIHVPFCRSRCGYCNLFSLCGVNDTLMDSYVNTLENEASFIGENFNLAIDEFIIGGGTPLYLSEDNLEKILSIPKKYFNHKLDDIFIGIETSPKDTTLNKMHLLKKYKVNRISMGIQSFVDEELKSLNRIHRLEDIENALDLLKSANFDTVNLDLIYGIENQTMESFKYSLDRIVEFEPDEIFLYPLYIRDNKHINSSGISKYEFYKMGRDFLLENGYSQKSMRRFSLGKNKTSRCGFSNSLSLGVGGRSYVGNLHYCNRYTDVQKNIKTLIEAYIDKENFSDIDFGFYLDLDEQKRLFLIKNLFTSNGLTLSQYEENFSSKILDDYPIISKWIKDGYFSIIENNIFPTDEGLALSDYLGPKLISEKVQAKMDAWKDDYEY